ncbi:MAG TPA: M20 family metallopeptidase [Pirellulales bacterium]|jgi:acetylornithine deacetylase|nr:M20 family metallopeptidase [Pirellulales bacterium]
MTLDLVNTLSDLVAIPSVNPMGRTVSGPEYFEHQLTDHLERLFQRMGLRTERQTIAPLRDNILATVDGSVPPERGGPLVLFEVHQDTVPVDGMTIEPWTPAVRDGRLYGRGSCDVKGGMAAMLCALARLAEERPAGRATVVLACTVNEEHGFTGASGLCRLWSGERSSLIPRAPDAAIVAEPTRLGIVVAHKGVVRWRCRTNGRAAHSSLTEAGDNAIYRMAPIVAALERYHRQVLTGFATHPLCGRPTLSVGTIAGGISVNTIPDRCTIEIDRRLLPGEDPARAYQQVIDYLSATIGDADALRHIEHDLPLMQSPGLSDAANGPLAARLADAVGEVTDRAMKTGVPFGTDAAAIARAGVPTVVFGPGAIDQAHTADEWVPLDEVAQASEILYRFASR